MSAENLHAAFRKTGIYPFDSSAISNECVKPAEVYDNDNDTNNTIHMAVENNNVVSIEKSTVIDLPQTNSVQHEKEQCPNTSPSEFLNCRIAELKNSKSNAPFKKVRNTISQIVSGKAVTETNITKQIIEHKSCQDNKKKCAKSSASKPLKRKSSVVRC